MFFLRCPRLGKNEREGKSRITRKNLPRICVVTRISRRFQRTKTVDYTSVMCELRAIIEKMSVFAGDDGIAYAEISEEGQTLQVPLCSGTCISWVTKKLIDRVGVPPSPKWVLTALKEAEQLILMELRLLPVGHRCRVYSDTIHLYLADGSRRIASTSASGVDLCDRFDVILPDHENMLPLPEPSQDKGLAKLWTILGLNPIQSAIATAFLLGALQEGPYQALVVVGPDTRSINKVAGYIRKILDPHKLGMRKSPKSERDVASACQNTFVLGYCGIDALSSRAQGWIGDALLGVPFTESSHGQERVLFHGARPAVLTCASLATLSPGLLEHSLVLRFASLNLPEDSELESEFRKHWPGALGTLLRIASVGLANYKNIKPSVVYRDCKFERLLAASAPAWEHKIFLHAYERMCLDTLEDQFDEDAFASGFRDFVYEERTYEGTAGELLQTLAERCHQKGPNWPKSAKGAAERLRRHRFDGIKMQFNVRQGHDRRRLIIASAANRGADASAGIA